MTHESLYFIQWESDISCYVCMLHHLYDTSCGRESLVSFLVYLVSLFLGPLVSFLRFPSNSLEREALRWDLKEETLGPLKSTPPDCNRSSDP